MNEQISQNEILFKFQEKTKIARRIHNEIIRIVSVDQYAIKDLLSYMTDSKMEIRKALIQMADIGLGEVDIEKYAKAAENEIDRELKAAKAQSELAKAGKVSSEKDKLDLDFVEQASGLKQERELESQLMVLQFKDRISKQSKEIMLPH